MLAELRHRQLLAMFVLLNLLLLGGAAGYMVLEGWRFLDAYYMAVITLTTVGFGEVRRLSDPGRIFTIVYVLSGVAYAGATISLVTAAITSGTLRSFLKGKKMLNQIARLKGHQVLCGYGRVGSEVARELLKNRQQVVVVERDPEGIQSALADGCLVIEGDATHEEFLRQARVDQAAGIITALKSDADNLYDVLTARDLNPDIYIISRAGEPDSQGKLRRAGADKVVAPSLIGGKRMAYMMLQPSVIDFLDTFMHAGETEFSLVQQIIPARSPVAGKRLAESNLRSRTNGILIMALRKQGSQEITIPTADTLLEAGDLLVLLGTEKQLELMRAYLKE